MKDRTGDETRGASRRDLIRGAASTAAAFVIVPRHVLGGAGYVPPSDKVTIASIGLGRQGQAITMELLARPDVQIVAVCDCNEESKNYAEYGDNALLKAARRLLGPGYEHWGADLASPGSAQLTHDFRTSLGMGGRKPAHRLVEAIMARAKAQHPARTKGAASTRITANCLPNSKIWMRFTSRRPITGMPRFRLPRCESANTFCARSR
jgi:hypothetical protein